MTPTPKSWLVPLLSVAAATAGSSAAAQDRPSERAASVTPPGGQVSTDRGEAVPAVDQVSHAASRLSAPAQIAPPTTARPDAAQVSGKAQGPTPTAQITSARRSAQAGQQLSSGDATAEAPSPLSMPSQGRRQAAERLTGRDRCDPGAPGTAPTTCARVIETRSGEFTRADPLVLSPEQRLLVDQRLRDAPRTATATVDRIGRNSVDADSAEAQGLASVVLGAPGTTEAAPPAEADPTAALPAGIGAALIEALVERAQGIPR